MNHAFNWISRISILKSAKLLSSQKFNLILLYLKFIARSCSQRRIKYLYTTTTEKNRRNILKPLFLEYFRNQTLSGTQVEIPVFYFNKICCLWNAASKYAWRSSQLTPHPNSALFPRTCPIGLCGRCVIFWGLVSKLDSTKFAGHWKRRAL